MFINDHNIKIYTQSDALEKIRTIFLLIFLLNITSNPFHIYSQILSLSQQQPSSSITISSNSLEAYNKYISAYKQYQHAVNQKVPEAKLKELASKLKEAKKAYELSINSGNINTLNNLSQNVNEACTESQSNYSNAYTTNIDITRSDLNAHVHTNTTFTTSTSNIFYNHNLNPSSSINSYDTYIFLKNLEECYIASLPPYITQIIKRVWSNEGHKFADHALSLLNSYSESYKGTPTYFVLKYEIAKIYEIYKSDIKTSSQILSQIVASNSTSPQILTLATNRLKYLYSLAKQIDYKKQIHISYTNLESIYSNYRKTSWLAIPVKLFKYSNYLTKLIDFVNLHESYDKFMQQFEEIAAPFMPPVEVIYNVFKPQTSQIEENATVRLIYDNPTAWFARWKLLHEAKHSIYIQYFIIEDDIFGISLCGLLYQKAKEGVKIKLMLDARGSPKLTKKPLGQVYLQHLAAFPNVEIRTFNPIHQNLESFFYDPRLLMASNHDKIFIVDEEYSLIGGRNISKNYFSDPKDYPSCFRDCDILIKSKTVANQLITAFEEEFSPLKQFIISKDIIGKFDDKRIQLTAAYLAMNSFIRDSPNIKLPPQSKLNKELKKYYDAVSKYRNLNKYLDFKLLENSYIAPVKIIDKHSIFGFRNDITEQLIRFIDGSKKEIIIQNPYVVLTERTFSALKRASKRGTKIYIHTNSPISTDSLPTQAMFYSDWQKILSQIPTCRIFTYYGQIKLHAKNFVFDNKIGIIGTYNLDYLSQNVNSEVLAAVNSLDFSTELRKEILSDIANSKEYKIKILPDNTVKPIFGPDHLPSENMWLLKTIAKLHFLRKFI